MSKRILIPYFLAGSGHLVSATAIHHYLSEKRPDWDIRLFEPADALNIERLNRLYKRSWHFVLKRPRFSGLIFFLSKHLFPFIAVAVNRRVIRLSAPAMKRFLDDYRPDLIITTHWGCGHLAAEAMRTGSARVPLVVVRNDLGGAFELQKVDCDLTVVMSSDAIGAFKMMGVPEERLMQANLLVRPQFVARDSEIDAIADGKEELRILLSSGGEGLGNIRRAADLILSEADAAGRSVAIDILAGRNDKLKKELESAIDDHRVTIHGYTEDVHVLMRRADLVVGKCGANYTMETAMMRKPFLVTQVGAPSEKPNMRFIIGRGLGWLAETPKKLRTTISKILRDPRELEEKQRCLNALPIKNGAEEIAERIIVEVEKPLPILDRPRQ